MELGLGNRVGNAVLVNVVVFVLVFDSVAVAVSGIPRLTKLRLSTFISILVCALPIPNNKRESSIKSIISLAYYFEDNFFRG